MLSLRCCGCVALLLLSVARVTSIVIGREQGNYVGDVTLDTLVCDGTVYVALRSPTAGYAGIAWLDNDRTLHGAHEDTDISLLYLDRDGTAHVADMVSLGVRHW